MRATLVGPVALAGGILAAAACDALVQFPSVPSLVDAGVNIDAAPRRDGSATDVLGLDEGRPPDAARDVSPRRDAALLDGGAPSCRAGGSGESSCAALDASCCVSLPVTGGTFARAYGDAAAPVAFPATVGSFRLDELLVTVARFRAFVHAVSAGYLPPPGAGKHGHLHGGLGLANGAGTGFETGWLASDDPALSGLSQRDAATAGCDGSTWAPAAGPGDSLPINCINWYEAYAFCIWDGGFLPSETEWQYAAAGGVELRPFPWGPEDPGDMKSFAVYDCDYPTPAPCLSSPVVADIAPVGTAASGAGKWGQRDLVGEVFEWTLDWYAPYTSPWVNAAQLTPYTSDAGPRFDSRALRGGDFEGPEAVLHTSFRDVDTNSASEISRSPNIGVRCARVP